MIDKETEIVTRALQYWCSPWEFYRNVQHRTRMIDLQNYIWFISVQGFCLNIYFQYSFGTITYNFPANFLYTVQQRENPPRERRQPASGLGNCGASQDYDFCHTVYSGFLTSFNILKTRKYQFKFHCFLPVFVPISRKISKDYSPVACC